jgi:hypothetical protein
MTPQPPSGIWPVLPLRGTLTVSFANVAAYETFDPQRPFDRRQTTHNFNRIGSDAWLDGNEDSVELRRARAMGPVAAAADQGALRTKRCSCTVVPQRVPAL